MLLRGNSRINERGNLEIGGCDAIELTQKYGTPLIVYDEDYIRAQCRTFLDAFNNTGVRFQVAYASKAFSSLAIAKIIHEEGLALDVVSGGELYTALKAGFPAERIHFHGNNKSVDELRMALDANIGCYVIDNFYEMELLKKLTAERNQTIQVLLRITPGIHASTHKYIQTGHEDSKFGFDLNSGQVLEAIQTALSIPQFRFLGLHFHIGSQIFESAGFIAAIEKIVDSLGKMKLENPISVLNIGGGFGIRYRKEDHALPVKDLIQDIVHAIQSKFEEINHPIPEIWIEPGRSIVGEAGTTLYTIGSIKEIPGVRNYASIDGGMSDNLRPALYQAKYEAMVANRALEKEEVLYSIAGKLCESGDMLIWDIALPKLEPGDILAVACTGAYGYSMANNYNRIPRPAVVFVRNGESRLVINRESYEDLLRNELFLPNSYTKSLLSL